MDGRVEVEWMVQAVFDPDGTGGDFAYTVGVFERHGVPELHVWARPTDGFDPGEDWMFSVNDRMVLLNDVAARCVSGELTIGDRWAESYDGGFTTVEFTLTGPVDRDDVEAFAVPPGTPVCELRWSLSRAPVPSSPTPVSSAWETEAADMVATLEAAAGDRERLWGAAGATSTAGSADGAAAQLCTMVPSLVVSVDGLAEPLVASISTASTSRYAMAVARAAARSVGRVAEVAEAWDLAAVHAAALCEWIGDDDEFAAAARTHVTHHLAAAYSVLVVADVVGDDVLDAGAGWVLALLDPVGAQERFDALHPTCSDPGATPVGVPSPAQLAWRVWTVGAATAAAGSGAPLCDDDEVAWVKLAAAGFTDE